MNRLILNLAALGGFAAALPAMTAAANAQTVRQREVHQQQRIDQARATSSSSTARGAG